MDLSHDEIEDLWSKWYVDNYGVDTVNHFITDMRFAFGEGIRLAREKAAEKGACDGEHG